MFNLKPFQEQSNNFFELFNSMEKSFFNDMGLSFSQHRAQFYDEGSHYRLEVDLPGYRKEDIAIQVTSRYLTLTAKKETYIDPDQNSNYQHQAQMAGGYQRIFDMTNIDIGGIDAMYQNGQLHLFLPKSQLADEAPIQIPIR